MSDRHVRRWEFRPAHRIRVSTVAVVWSILSAGALCFVAAAAISGGIVHALTTAGIMLTLGGLSAALSRI